MDYLSDEFKQICYKDQSLCLNVSEYDQEIAQSHTTEQLTTPWWRAIEHKQSQDNSNKIEAKQLAPSSSTRWLKN